MKPEPICHAANAFLATAQGGDSSVSNLTLALASLGIIVAAAMLAMVPLGIAATRHHRQPHNLLLFALLWACLAGGSAIYTTMMQMRWSAERDLRIKTGYYDAQDSSDAPVLPWGQWAALAGGYVALIAWAAIYHPRRLDGPQLPN